METKRQNLLSLFRREGYSQAPVEFSLCPSLEKQFRDNISKDADVSEYYGFPWRSVGTPEAVATESNWQKYYETSFKDGTRFDAYGVAHEPGSEAAGHMTKLHYPLAKMETLEQLQSYPYPTIDESTVDVMSTRAKKTHDMGFASIGFMAQTIWERAWAMRSMDMLMMDMFEEDPKASFLLDKITQLSCLQAASFARSGVDILLLGDDVGMQSSLMMSADMYRQWLKPRLKKVIDAARNHKPDVIVMYHSCGYVLPLIDDLIEVGVDVLNPVQPESMAFEEVHQQFGDRLSFWGTIGTQTTMPFGKPEDVKEAVYRNLTIAGKKGGLFCAPTHLLEPEVPWANIEAYIQACRDFTPA